MANAIDQLTDRVLMLGRLTIVRRAITAVAVTISAVLQTFLIQAFIQPADLLPHGAARPRDRSGEVRCRRVGPKERT